MLATSCHINVDIQLWNARSKKPRHVLYMDKWRDWECIDIVRGIIGTVNSIAWRLTTLEFITDSKD
ncbi:hypothetical protein BGX23_010945 [Mortierella sp. AD031]|nr:hypothetical protein BGX23_010945 [Mortierella sp. AD031]